MKLTKTVQLASGTEVPAGTELHFSSEGVGYYQGEEVQESKIPVTAYESSDKVVTIETEVDTLPDKKCEYYSPELEKFLKANNIKWKVLTEENEGGFPEMRMTGSLKALKAWYDKFFATTSLAEDMTFDELVSLTAVESQEHTLTIEIDVTEPLEADKSMVTFMQKNGIVFKQVKAKGPSGHPVYKLIGSQTAIKLWYDKFYSDGGETFADFLEYAAESIATEKKSLTLEVELVDEIKNLPEISEVLAKTNIAYKLLNKSGQMPIYTMTGPEDDIRTLYEKCFSNELDWAQFLQEYKVSNESGNTISVNIEIRYPIEKIPSMHKDIKSLGIKCEPVDVDLKYNDPTYKLTGPEPAIRQFYANHFADGDFSFDDFLKEWAYESAGSRNSFIVVVPDVKGYNAFGVDSYNQALDEATDYEYAWILDASSMSINVTALLETGGMNYAEGVYLEYGEIVTPEPRWSKRNPGIGVVCVIDKGGPEVTAFASQNDVDFQEFLDNNRKAKVCKLK